MLTAALDAARLGARAPLSADLLRAAAPGYCTSQQQAEAPDNWFEQALAYATGKLHGAAAALSPAGAGMGQVAGYTAADYLIQHASRERRSARVPASTWDAVLSHIRDPADAARLADSARNRLLYRYAIPLYRHAADAGDGDAAGRLAELLAERGDLDGPSSLRARADAGDRYAAWRLAELLAERGDLDGLRARADAGDGAAARRLAELLAERGDLDGLRARADAGDEDAAGRLAELLAERGDLDGLRARADAGDEACRRAAGRAAGRARRPGRAARPGRRRRRGPPPALAELLAERGDLDGLRARADAGDGDAAGRLAELLAERGDLDGLRARADAGDGAAARRLADLLAERGDLDEAARPGRRRRRGLPPGGWPSCWPSAATWTGCAPGPTPATGTPPCGWPSCWPSAATWTRAARPGRRRRRGCRPAAGRAAGRARRPGRGGRSCAPGPTPATVTPPGGWPSCWPRGDLDDGCASRRRRPPPAAGRLLAERGDLDGCAPGPTPATGRRRAAGRPAGRARRPGRAARPGRRRRQDAAWRLAELLAERGDLDGLRARADAGDGDAAGRLADLLAERGDLDELRARADAGDGHAAGGWPTAD